MNRRILFAYNGPIYKDIDGRYYSNELNDIIIDRYRYLGNEVNLLIRVKNILDSDKFKVRPFINNRISVIEIDYFFNIFSYLYSFISRKKIIQNAVKKHDIIIGRLPSAIGRLAISFAKRYKKPYIVEVVGCPWDALWNHSLTGKVLAPLAFFKLKFQVFDAPFVMYVTSHFLQNRYPSYLRNIGVSDVIINDVSLSVLNERKKRISDFEKDNIINICTIGGLDVSYKRQSDVLKAISILKKDKFRFKYFLIGKGIGVQLRRLIDKLNLKEEVILMGEIPHNQIYHVLSKIDLYIQPSKMEGLPRSLIEAMSLGCPCIGSDAGGIPELLSNEMIYAKGDVFQLTQILKNINKNILLEESDRNFKLSKKFYIKVLDERRQHFYEEFLSAEFIN